MRSIQPVIFNRIGKERKGKGFSREELKQVGLTAWIAQRIGLSVDLRRSSTYEENIEALEQYLKDRQAELEEKRQAGRAKKEAQIEARLKKEQERPKIEKKERPVTVKEVAPVEMIDVAEPAVVEAESEITQVEEENTPLSDLEGITSDEIEMLQVQNIEYAEDLLGLSAEDMDEIANTSEMERERIETLVFLAVDKLESPIPLREIPGIGEKTAELLECSGIYSGNQLARTDPTMNCEGISSDRLKKFIDKAWEKILNS